ncbi:MAG TPA: thioredoxin family protein [Anaerolineales bacterium]|nr:thioredoxin family protein [Anaerolineales bacterium]
MAAKPIVDGIEKQHADNLVVIRVNVQDDAMRPLMKTYAFQFTPTFILFDPAGGEIYRTVGAIDPKAIDQTLASTP